METHTAIGPDRRHQKKVRGVSKPKVKKLRKHFQKWEGRGDEQAKAALWKRMQDKGEKAFHSSCRLGGLYCDRDSHRGRRRMPAFSSWHSVQAPSAALCRPAAQMGISWEAPSWASR